MRASTTSMRLPSALVAGQCAADRVTPQRFALKRDDAPFGRLGQHERVVSDLAADVERV